jgi:hypothetical protein
MRYIINKETNEFREFEEGDDYEDCEILEEHEVTLIDSDIEAVFAQTKGEITRLGIINDGELLVSAELNLGELIALFGMLSLCIAKQLPKEN